MCAVWAAEAMRTVPVTRSASTSSVSTRVNKREPVVPMLCAASPTRMLTAGVRRGSQECPHLSRAVSGYHQDVPPISVQQVTVAREDCVTPSVGSTLTAPRVRDVWMVCAPRCVTVTRTVSREKSVLRPVVSPAVTRRRIVDQEKYVKMETVFVVLVSSILPPDVWTSMSVRSPGVTPVPSAPTHQDHSSAHVPEVSLETPTPVDVRIPTSVAPTETVDPTLPVLEMVQDTGSVSTHVTEPGAEPTVSVQWSTTDPSASVLPSMWVTPIKLWAAPRWSVRPVETALETRCVR